MTSFEESQFKASSNNQGTTKEWKGGESQRGKGLCVLLDFLSSHFPCKLQMTQKENAQPLFNSLNLGRFLFTKPEYPNSMLLPFAQTM